jgi:2-iminobutanoate/2-iminopropanoate deaminase
MVRHYNPPGVAPPVAAYSHAAEVKAGGRLIYLAGQVGIDPQGNLLDGAEAQAEQVYRNIKAIVEDAGLGLGNIAKLTTFMVDPAEVGAMRAARDKVFGDVKPPSTLVFITQLASPELRIEIEAVVADD